MLDPPRLRSRRPNYKRAVCYCLRNIPALLSLPQKLRRADGRARLSKGEPVMIDNTESPKTEVAHGPRRGSDIKRIAGVHKHYNDALELVR